MDFRSTAGRGGLLLRLVPALAAAAALAACDFDVTNPGPVQDEFLNDSTAHAALVNGAGRAVSEALAWLAYTGGVAALELQGSGSITDHGVTLLQRAGTLSPDNAETDDHWALAQRARWVSEEAVRRISASNPQPSRLGARAALYAGYANRLLGENMCVAVIDGGAAEPRTVYTQRAEDAFTSALEQATAVGYAEVRNAALAGRASVRAWQGDWSGVVADASLVPTTFVFNALYAELDDVQHNRIFYAGANTPFRSATVWSTFFATYYTQTGDPRTPWSTLAGFPNGDGSTIPFYRQLKYTSRTAPMRLSSDDEMQLLLAEARLRSGDWEGALGILNALRAESGMAAETVTGTTAVWTVLKRERAVELWIEGRALGDAFRYQAEGTPGTPVQSLAGRDKCFPIGITEIDTNPNVDGPTG